MKKSAERILKAFGKTQSLEDLKYSENYVNMEYKSLLRKI